MVFVSDKDSEFSRGIDSLYAVVGKSQNYPETVIRDLTDQKVSTTFVSGSAGKVTKPKVIEGVRADLNHAAMESINEIQYRIPVGIGGKKVSVRQKLSVNFKL